MRAIHYLVVFTGLYSAVACFIGWACLFLAPFWAAHLLMISFDWWTDRPWA